ncbi:MULTISPECIES: FecCD family ABC transporter permease [Cyanophyceae]|uniref:FecCD family ABC transporter permease n=1 Tax=Cyanophyceae TaxID=3028117 RepID=UPI00232C3429|nr:MULTISPECIES: iron ABC transporter permease [Cyanophyceae]MDB9306895.1 iron ABC transporter permease [Nodularia spumigena CS-591/12]MDB9340126.1 iron ABC transporter permease [Nodularia spumigena CS-589/07]MDB9348944.1 iron ABC transporter permease [Nodularia spumigena CS-588/01]MDB9352797.1 iron ABC transporter permease [Nodularia spumigena CS-588/05]MDB9399670.1 iron ABC transporter permease [Microcystis aeruginosa CS-567/02-A1]
MRNNSLIFRSKIFPISFRLQKRVPIVLLILVIITLVTMVISTSIGEYPTPPLAVIQTVLGIDTGNPEYAFVINTLRLPRTLTAALVGMALGISGTIMQGITRNPLAAPGIIGINAGAGLAAVSLIVLFPNLPARSLPLAAFGGALAAAVLIYLLAWDSGTHPIRLILIGVGISAVSGAFTSLLVTFGEINNVSQALVWLAGSIYGRSWEQLVALLPWLIVFIPLALASAPQLNALALGDELAQGLGSRVEWQRSFLILISAALSGAAVATAGSIGFVGLISPHIARQLVGGNHQGLIPVSAIWGAMIVVVADLLGRIIFAPVELPCGIVTAVIGAPYFIYLLVQTRKK